MRRGGCLELYYCNMVEWFWWDSSLILTTNWFPSVLWHCWLGHLACKNCPRNDLLCVERDVTTTATATTMLTGCWQRLHDYAQKNLPSTVHKVFPGRTLVPSTVHEWVLCRFLCRNSLGIQFDSLASVNWLVGKIVSEMTRNVSHWMLNLLYCTIYILSFVHIHWVTLSFDETKV